ncbi:MAG: 5'-nucleosidase [Steroidobacteraceae bacterium]|nr:5'-nucleosidase [Steroidobacteraceae bacterium]
MAELLVVMALEIESQGVFEQAQIPVLFTGVGKVNAAHALTRKLAQYRHAGRPMPHVVNFGTAGSRVFSRGTVVACHAFVQLDMDVTPLGFEAGVTPFDPSPAKLEFPRTLPNLPHGVCGSADTFETSGHAPSCDVRDMEAYALAKVCWVEKAPFTCVKYVTDGADEAAATDWEANLPKAAAEFLRIYRELSAVPGTRP